MKFYLKSHPNYNYIEAKTVLEKENKKLFLANKKLAEDYQIDVEQLNKKLWDKDVPIYCSISKNHILFPILLNIAYEKSHSAREHEVVLIFSELINDFRKIIDNYNIVPK